MPPPFVTGVQKLNTRFPRLPGDIGNPASIRGDVVFKTIEKANPATIITGKPLPAPMIDAFVDGTLQLIQQPVDLITTSCGFLLPLQDRLTRCGNVPVLTSSLLLLPLLRSMHGPDIGILTFDRDKLIRTPANIKMPEAVEGLQSCDLLRQTIVEDLTELDKSQALANTLDCANRLLSRWPATRALVLECTNLSPYKHELRTQLRLPVYDLIDAIHWHQNATGCG